MAGIVSMLVEAKERERERERKEERVGTICSVEVGCEDPGIYLP
jgi:hypothetical protein